MYGFFMGLSRLMAYLGGIVLTGLIAMTCLSVLGREASDVLHGMIDAGRLEGAAQSLLNMGVGPVTGDFELTEAGIAFAIFAFLPFCQMTGGHASVDIFTSRLSPRADRLLRMATDGLFAIVLVMIAVQLAGGMQSKLRSGQTTFLIEFPIWWAYALSLSGAVVAATVACYIAVMRIREAAAGTAILPQPTGTEH